MNATSQTSSHKTTSAPAIIEGALKEADKLAEKKPTLVSADTMIAAITDAAAFGKKALYLEMATGLALFTELEEVNRDTKQALQKIYVSAGYDAEDQFKTDYKTVRRRIDASAELFDWIGGEIVAGWIGKKKEMSALTTIIKQLEQYDLRGINSVFALVGKPVGRKAPKEHPSPPGEEGAKGGVEKPSEGVSEAAEMVGREVERGRTERAERNRRAEDIEGSVVIGTDHLKVAIPPSATKSELIQLAMTLLEYANTVAVGEEVMEIN